jgi:arsenate reductase
LKEPLDRAVLGQIANWLPDPPAALVRRDKNFSDLALDPEAYETVEAVVELLLEHPKLMQRPIFVSGGRAVICRPADKVLELV